MSSTFPDEWSEERFDSFCVLQRGFDLPLQNRSDGNYPIFGSNGIVGYHNEGPVKAPCVVTGRSGSIGQVWYLKEDFWALNTSLYVKSFHGNNPKYVYFFLERFDLSRFSTGTGVPTLNRNDVHCIEIRYPPLPEQKKIASILTSVDEVIEKAESQIEKLQDLKTGMMQELLTKGIGHTEFKDSPGGRIPVEWNTNSLQDISDAPICYGIVQVGSYVPDGVSTLAIKNLGVSFRKNINRTSKDIESKYVRSRIQGGDLLISVKGTIGRVDVVPDWFNGNISRDIVRIRPISNVLPVFLKYFFQSTNGMLLLEITSVGTTRAELSVHRLKALHVPLPSFDEQIEIVGKLDSIDSKIAAVKKRWAHLGSLKKALMQDLLTGKVRVKAD